MAGVIKLNKGAICCIVAINCISVLVYIALGAAEIAIGTKYDGIAGEATLNGTSNVTEAFMFCQVQHMIPTYLKVNGAVCHIIAACLVLGITLGLVCGGPIVIIICFVLSILVGIFSFAWLIAGSVWIYSIKETFSPNPDDPAMYCDPTLYWFAFWVTTASWILLAVQCIWSNCSRRSSRDDKEGGGGFRIVRTRT